MESAPHNANSLPRQSMVIVGLMLAFAVLMQGGSAFADSPEEKLIGISQLTDDGWRERNSNGRDFLGADGSELGSAHLVVDAQPVAQTPHQRPTLRCKAGQSQLTGLPCPKACQAAGAHIGGAVESSGQAGALPTASSGADDAPAAFTLEDSSHAVTDESSKGFFGGHAPSFIIFLPLLSVGLPGTGVGWRRR